MRYLLLVVIVGLFSCKKSTSYQVVLFNDSAEQLKVKVFSSSITLAKDSFVLNSLQQIEVFYKEEEGLNSVYQCKGGIDSVYVYSPAHKLKVNGFDKTLWQYSENHGKYKEQHKCSLALSLGDTIQ